MLENIENLKLLDVIQKESAPQLTILKRFSHALVFKINGTSSYHFPDKTITISTGELLFIPKDSSYQVKRISDKSEYVLINFDADLSDAAPQFYSLADFPDTIRISTQLEKLWLFGEASERYQCYCIFYSLFSFILKKETNQYSYQKKFKKIKPAVDYLQANIFHCDLSVEKLHLLCNLSDTYFRKIFKANFGTTPQAYITNKRLSQARSIILSGDYRSIGEVAYSVGYHDALYFSRLFSKKYGICPSEFHAL